MEVDEDEDEYEEGEEGEEDAKEVEEGEGDHDDAETATTRDPTPSIRIEALNRELALYRGILAELRRRRDRLQFGDGADAPESAAAEAERCRLETEIGQVRDHILMLRGLSMALQRRQGTSRSG